MADLQQQGLEVASKTRVRPNRKKPERSGCTGRGVKILREAAGKAVDENGEGIAESLLKGALSGNVSSTKLLLSLAESDQAPGAAGKSRHGWSAALALGAEPEWQEAADETTAETQGGSREPEG
ncbi:MAG: hypothetical protein ABR924_09915 [Terracidiphilus sp.]|jgi:hypothetical protein